MNISRYYTIKLRQIAYLKAVILILVSINLILLTSCVTRRSDLIGDNMYAPHDKEIYKKIAGLDSIFWKAYNDCDMATQALLYSDSIEFYHDQAGLITSKEIILDATKANICGKIRRDIVEGSLEVYPIPGFGAVELGKHTFRSVTDKETAIAKPVKFVIIWKKQGDRWVITKVISLH